MKKLLFITFFALLLLSTSIASAEKRALIVGNTYPNHSYVEWEKVFADYEGFIESVVKEWRGDEAFENDVNYVAGALEGSEFAVQSKINLSNKELFEAIEGSFLPATDNDISLFYFSGHGAQDAMGNGALTTYSDNERGYETIDYQDIIAAFNKIKGKKIILIAACYSGEIFKHIDQNDPDLYIITVARHDEVGYKEEAIFFEEYSKTYFADAVATALGRDGVLAADADNNGVVSFNELARYLQENVKTSTVVANAVDDIEIVDNIRYETIIDIDASQTPAIIVNGLKFLTANTKWDSEYNITWEPKAGAVKYYVLLKLDSSAVKSFDAYQKFSPYHDLIAAEKNGTATQELVSNLLGKFKDQEVWFETTETSISVKQAREAYESKKNSSFGYALAVVFYE